MWPLVLPDSSPALDSSFASPSRDSPHFFLKAGRKIRVGDCALFEQPHDTPPFVGIIRKLTGDEEDRLTVRVNYLYRPLDVKLGKGNSFEAAPNEVFYSFHKDEIPAGLLLHPCKVAFLRKGSELPSGVSSFVCRRVYDIENKCLWWLTDKDYVNEQQEEIDSLLNKTQLDMHGTVQSGGRSPKPLNGATSASQVKTNTDTQNTGSVLSHVKSKKRERGDQGCDPSKRERLHKPEDCDSGQTQVEFKLKSEIAKITDRGGLVGFNGVEKLVQLMQPEAANNKIDLDARIMLVDVISATDRSECLGWFVQLRGLPVLDDWLQEAHKGKVGDSSSTRENDKSVEECLFALLRALDKLPVNLHALQTCNIGKSVNHLRTHKNAEIQKKARGLVDTWKKRVEAEMNMNDGKLGPSRGASWPAKPVPSECSLVGNKRSGGPVDAGTRSSGMPSSVSRSYQVKAGSGEDIAKLSASSGPCYSGIMATISNMMDPNVKTSPACRNPELSLTPIKEERSSSSSQSLNNSQSCSSDHVKTVGSYIEDARTSPTGFACKSSSVASRHGKLTNGVNPLTLSGVRKEIGSTKVSSPNQNSVSDQLSPTGVSQLRSTELHGIDNGICQWLTVDLPNNVQSPSCGVGGINHEDPAPGGDKASPAAKRKNCGNEARERNLAVTFSCMNSDTCQRMDFMGGSDEGNAVIISDEKHKAVDDIEKTMEASKDTKSLLAAMPQSRKSYDVSLSSMNALVESCVKFSEASEFASPEDDIGMNLLATVAAGEILKSDHPSSPSSSPKRSSLVEESFSLTDGNLSKTALEVTEEQQTEDRKNSPPCSKEVKKECVSRLNTSCPVLQQVSEFSSLKIDFTSCGFTCDSSATVSPLKIKGDMEVEGAIDDSCNGQTGSGWDKNCSLPDSDSKLRCPISEDVENDNVNEGIKDGRWDALSDSVTRNKKVDQETHESPAASLLEMDGTMQYSDKQELANCINTKGRQSPSEPAQLNSSGDMMGGAYARKDVPKIALGSLSSDLNVTCASGKPAGKEAPGAFSSNEQPTVVPTLKNEASATSNWSKLVSDESGGHVSGAKLIPRSGSTVKMDFDLNEGFLSDDGNQAEAAKQADFGVSSAANLSCSSPITVPAVTISFSTSITVAAAAKGAFVPPDNPLRGKGELGWKGSAATSAFRPAEPRRILDIPVNSSEIPAGDTAVGTQSRRPLDFDLNIADEQVLEDVCKSSGHTSCFGSGPHAHGSGGLDLDLNKVDENYEAGTFCLNNSSMSEVALTTSRPSLASAMSNVASTTTRDFDLNNGPGVDEFGAERASCGPPVNSSSPFPSSLAGIRINGSEFGNYSSWFPPTHSYSAFTGPSILPGRVEQNYLAAAGSQRILAASASSTSSGLEMYRAPVLPSSQAVSFPSTSPFPYSGLPCEPSFPPSSSFLGSSTVYGDSSTGGPLCFPTIPSQLVGPTSVMASSFSRPFVMTLPSFPSGLGSDSRRWASQIDLNSGPGGIDLDRRDERFSTAVKQQTGSGSQLADEQLKSYHIPGGIASAGGLFRRKEPDVAWDSTDRFSYKHSSSQ